MNAHTTLAKPRAARAKLSIATRSEPVDAVPPPAPAAAPAAPTVVPPSPQLIPLGRLRRAAENVRHTRIDEDVTELAADIAAHGLLQNLIGYTTAGAMTDPDPATLAWQHCDGLVHIVGGGRRLQALQRLRDDGAIAADFAVPVLVRAFDEAIELSLAEYLQQRAVSPVDEFFAFAALIERGTWSVDSLAKRFGLSERHVRQRLRLAQLEPEVLDALRERRITLDAAMAYAASQSAELQRDVFRAETRKATSYRHAHRPDDIRHAIRMKGETTDSALFRFVGADAYEARGGGYEDDLFRESKPGQDVTKTLSRPHLLPDLAREAIEARMPAMLDQLRGKPDWSPTIVGHVVTDSAEMGSYGWTAKAWRGQVRVSTHDPAKLWRTARKEEVPVNVIVGVNGDGELTASRSDVFVLAGLKDAIDPPAPSPAGATQTPEQTAAAERLRGAVTWSRKLAVSALLAGTPAEGRTAWPQGWRGNPEARTLDGIAGWSVPVDIFVTQAEIEAQRDAAGPAYDEELAARAAAEAQLAAERARNDELRAMAPPAIVIVDGLAWERQEGGGYSPLDDPEDGFLPSWYAAIANFGASGIDDTFATRDDFDQRQDAAIAALEVKA